MSRIPSRLRGAPTALAAALVVTLVPAASDAAATQTARLSFSDTRATVGDRVRAVATFTPARPGRTVLFQQQRGGEWVTVATRAQGRTGRAAFLPPTTAGSRVYRAVTTARGSLPTRTSAAARLRVTGPGTYRVSAGAESEPVVRHDMSADGRFVVYGTRDDDGERGSRRYLFDRRTASRTTLPITSVGDRVAISADGSTVVSEQSSPASPVLGAAVMAYATATGTLTASPGVHAADGSDGVADQDPSVSDDGRRVALHRFTIASGRLVRESVVVWDRATGAVREALGIAVDLPALGAAIIPTVTGRISGDGAWVVVNRVDTTGAPTGVPARIWSAATGVLTTLPAGAEVVRDLSSDARFLAVGGADARTSSILDRATGVVRPVRLGGAYRDWTTTAVTALSTTGRWLVVEGVKRGRTAVFLVGRATGRTVRVSLTWRGARVDATATGGSTSDDGRFVTFRTAAADVTAQRPRGGVGEQLFQRDRG